jgi:7,8-dihydropterin-6-yl-methyl-4-(beta-D-ribofuranosyl)aminobenzene 5'-phosphate synthase
MKTGQLDLKMRRRNAWLNGFLILLLSSCSRGAGTAPDHSSPDATKPSVESGVNLPDANQEPESQAGTMEGIAMETTGAATSDRLTITIVFDNRPFNPDLQTAWGFAALVEYRGSTSLFDTGGDAPILLANMRSLEIDPTRIKRVILSHNHNDHTGGLQGLLALSTHPLVYLLPSFPESTKGRIAQTADVLEVSPGQPLAAGVFTTGEIGGSIPEQALVVRSTKGLVMITGCAHPGVVQVIERAKNLFGEDVYLVMGGFHLGDKSAAEIEKILADFRRLGVIKVAPSHCTGDRAIEMFEKEYKQDFIRAGAGCVIEVEKD